MQIFNYRKSEVAKKAWAIHIVNSNSCKRVFISNPLNDKCIYVGVSLVAPSGNAYNTILSHLYTSIKYYQISLICKKCTYYYQMRQPVLQLASKIIITKCVTTKCVRPFVGKCEIYYKMLKLVLQFESLLQFASLLQNAPVCIHKNTQKRHRSILVPWLPYNADIVYIVRNSLMQKWCKSILHCRNYRGLKFRHYYFNFDQKRDFWAQKKISQHICAMTSL